MRTIKNLLFIIILLIFGQIKIEAQEKLKPTVGIHGLIQYNFEFHKIGDSTYAGNEFRKMVMTTKGKIYKNVSYLAQFDFAGGTVGMRDVYVKFGKIPAIGGHVILGVYHEPTGLDQFTGSKFKTFAERPMMASTQGFRWNPGIYYNNTTLLNKRMAIQLAYTFDGDRNKAFKTENINKGGNFIARVTGAIIKNKENNQLLHLGLHYENRQRPSEKYYNVFKPEVQMGEKIKFIQGKVESQNDYGFELAANYGSFSLQGEYELSTFSQGENNNSISGYYGFFSFFPTGENRVYKNTHFGMIVPKKNFCIKDGGWGAVEIAVRYSAMNYSDARSLPKYINKPIGGDEITSLTLGLNWYLNSHTRILYNYIIADIQQKDYFNANLIKLQVKF